MAVVICSKVIDALSIQLSGPLGLEEPIGPYGCYREGYRGPFQGVSQPAQGSHAAHAYIGSCEGPTQEEGARVQLYLRPPFWNLIIF